MKVEEGKIYMTRRGDLVDQVTYYGYGNAGECYFTGRMTSGDGSANFARWYEDGIYLGNRFAPIEVGNNTPAEIVAEIKIESVSEWSADEDDQQVNRMLLDSTLSDVEKMVILLEDYLLYH